MAISRSIQATLEKSSWIRRMFETGAKLKQEFGADQVYDFSLGNPDLDPPEEFSRALIREASRREPGLHSYMPNAGYPAVRESLAASIGREYAVDLAPNDLIMTVGAGGALNVALKSVINRGDYVAAPSPCFMEYQFYCENHGGILNLIPSDENFIPNLHHIGEELGPRTAAVIINSPNNPTGVVYDQEFLNRLGELLREKSRLNNRTIYLISDEPYRKIVYGEKEPGNVFSAYENSMIATSYSKELSIPGERIGWLAVNPAAEDHDNLVNAAVLCNRILGYVNAPALMQRVVVGLNGVAAEVEIYRKRRDLLCEILDEAGFEYTRPEGTFYLFPKAPGGDDLRVVQALQKERILTVPGRGFGKEGYFRISFCVGEETIRGAAEGFKRVGQVLGGSG